MQSEYNFVIVDVALGKNYVKFYDETLMGKDCNATSTLRYNFYFDLYKVRTWAAICICITYLQFYAPYTILETQGQ
jgi:hypothetical protein